MKRTHTCGQLTLRDDGSEVVLCGWVHSRRDHGGLIFIDVRDRYGITQIVFDPQKNESMHKLAETLRNEFVIGVRGKVGKRPQGTENPKLPTGEIEVLVETLEVINRSKVLPFEVNDDKELSEEVRLAYRFLDLRRAHMKNNILLRSRVMKVMRDFLDREGFIDIETPILTKSTPEGARDYLVPSRVNPGMFYALPQSPQLFKQMLMVAGFDKYYQIAKCFRDEDLRKDRQPEFTQLDIEMSFPDEETIYSLIERLLAEIFEKTLDKKLTVPFPRMPHSEAMRRYGSDKPDTRYGMELQDLKDLAAGSNFMVFKKVLESGGAVMGFKADGAGQLSLKQLDDLTQQAIGLGAKGLVWIKVSANECQSPVKKHLGDDLLKKLVEKFNAREGDLLLIVADAPATAMSVLGQLRVSLAEQFVAFKKGEFSFLWVTDFPLFHYNNEEKRWDSEHHPFTAPKEEDMSLLESGDYGKVRSCAYDLVVNDNELGSGSIRIHQPELQQKIFNILGLKEEEIKIVEGR